MGKLRLEDDEREPDDTDIAHIEDEDDDDEDLLDEDDEDDEAAFGAR